MTDTLDIVDRLRKWDGYDTHEVRLRDAAADEIERLRKECGEERAAYLNASRERDELWLVKNRLVNQLHEANGVISDAAKQIDELKGGLIEQTVRADEAELRHQSCTQLSAAYDAWAMQTYGPTMVEESEFDGDHMAAAFAAGAASRHQVIRWIPVAERLPEGGERVLARNSAGYCACVTSIFPTPEGFDGEDATPEETIYPIGDITHWMPILEFVAGKKS